jgi:hypothetical protein
MSGRPQGQDDTLFLRALFPVGYLTDFIGVVVPGFFNAAI